MAPALTPVRAAAEVPFLDLGAGYRELRDELDRAHARVMASGRFVLGPEVEAFEREFAGYCGVAERVAGRERPRCAVARAARARRRAGRRGDRAGHTFIATWLAVTALGARPVPVDCLTTTGNIDPARIERAITSRTRAIVPVHIYGQPADMDAVCAIAEAPRRARARGRRPGPRRPLRRPPGGLARPRRRVRFLSGQEPRRARRRRGRVTDDHDAAERGCARCATTARRGSTRTTSPG